MSRSQQAQLCEQAAIAGANSMLEEIASGRLVTANRKDDFTFVLNLDLMSDAAIRSVICDSAICDSTPISSAKLSIVSEEQPESHRLLGTREGYFLVDPLDGTNNCRRTLKFFGPKLTPMQESFGPIVGYVDNGIIECATFVSLPDRLVWSAVRGHGCRVTQLSDSLPEFEQRERMLAEKAPALRECGVLFYPGKSGELDLLRELRTRELVDGCYRLGGFAGDCTRLALAREQILIQFSLKPWDLVAGLLATEAGCTAMSYDGKQARICQALTAYPVGKILIANSACAEELATAISKF